MSIGDILDEEQSAAKTKRMLKIKFYVAFVSIFSFLFILMAFIANDTIEGEKVRKEQKINFIKKMRSQGWTYDCVAGAKMVFSKPEGEHPFMIRERCGSLK